MSNQKYIYRVSFSYSILGSDWMTHDELVMSSVKSETKELANFIRASFIQWGAKVGAMSITLL